MNNLESTEGSWEGIDELIRDITQAGFMPKSEARRRINELLDKARMEGREEGWEQGAPYALLLHEETIRSEATLLEKNRIKGVIEKLHRETFTGRIQEIYELNATAGVVAQALQKGWNQALDELKRKIEN